MRTSPPLASKTTLSGWTAFMPRSSFLCNFLFRISMEADHGTLILGEARAWREVLNKENMMGAADRKGSNFPVVLEEAAGELHGRSHS